MIIRVFAATAAAMVLFSGTAAAGPVKGAPELTHNDLYKAAKLPKVKCGLDKGTSRASAEKYAKRLVGCLNTAWKKAINDFEPIEAEITTDRAYCYTGLDIAGSFAVACESSMKVRLANDWIKAKSDLPIFVGIAAAYSGVVHGETGIGRAWWALDAKGDEAEGEEQTRRYSLQGDCFIGLSMKALGYQVKDWKPVLGLTEPAEFDRFKSSNGTPANRTYWLKKGYESGKPGACNTWTAASSKVA